MKESFEIALPKLALAAVAKFAAKGDIRYYLNAVCVEVGPDESRLIATNGHMIAVYRLERGALVSSTQSVIVPIERINAIEKPEGDGKFAATIVLSVEPPIDNQRFATFKDGETTMRFPLIDGKYPQYRSVMQVGRTNGKPASFQTQYLIACRDAGKILDGGDKFGCNFRISHNGDGPALIKFYDMNLVALLMPIRESMDALTAAPAWIADLEPAPAGPGDQTDLVDDDPFKGSEFERKLDNEGVTLTMPDGVTGTLTRTKQGQPEASA